MTPVEKSQEAVRLLEEAVLEMLKSTPAGVGPAAMSKALQIYRGAEVAVGGPRLNDGIVTTIMDKLEEEGKIINDREGLHGRKGRRYIR